MSYEVISTICGICNANCGVKIHMRDQRIIKVEGDRDHPVTKGYICPKGTAIKEIAEAPDRLTSPLLKDEKNDWRKISWDDAFDFMEEKMNLIKQAYGPESLAVHVGQAGVRRQFTLYAKRFCDSFATPNFSTAGSHCHFSKVMSNTYTYGTLPVADFKNSRCIVLWGYNPANSCPAYMKDINYARSNGALLVVIDPRQTSIAKEADYHIQARPGTDGALALGMLNVIIREKLYDHDFVKEWTIGFDELVKHTEKYTPEYVSAITWVSADLIRDLARSYAKSESACIAEGIALELQTNGFQTLRATSILQTITANLDIAGGSLFTPAVQLNSLKLSTNKKATKPTIGEQEFPLFHKLSGNAQANLYTEAILESKPYALKGLIVAGGNPLLTWPNSARVRAAFEKLDLLVVVDNFMTPTARLADLVLPASTTWSQYEIFDYAPFNGEARLVVMEPAIQEKGINNWMLWKTLAEKMGCQEDFHWNSEKEELEYRLESFRKLSPIDHENPVYGFEYSPTEYQKYLRNGFKTPSGKVEIYSSRLESAGYDALPTYQEPAESPIKTPLTAEDYPLVATTGARSLFFMHSRFMNIPSLRKLNNEPVMEINQATADDLGIEDGELVAVESKRGRIKIKARLSTNVDPRVVALPHGWEEANANMLTDNLELDPITGFPPDRSLLVRVVKLQ